MLHSHILLSDPGLIPRGEIPMLVKMEILDFAALGWIAVSSLYTLFLFASDKQRSRKPGKQRTSEFHLVLASAIGGWLGGLVAMLLFRHKTAKASFKLKFALAFLIFAGLTWGYLANRNALMNVFKSIKGTIQ